MRKVGRLAAIGVGAATGALAVAAPASAHVTVNADEAVAGERARVEFRVPNESDTESTTELEVRFPEETPISSVSVGTVAGWNSEITYRTLDEPIEDGHGGEVTEVVERITWTAVDEQAEVGPGEFVEFPVSLGPLPEADELVFPSLQTYSDDAVVEWTELGAEADRPAPALTLTSADQPEEAGMTSDENDEADAAADAAADTTSESGSGTWLGLAGLIAGLVGAVLGGLAFARSRRA